MYVVDKKKIGPRAVNNNSYEIFWDTLELLKILNILRESIACITLCNTHVLCRSHQDTKEAITCGELPYIVLIL